MDIGLRETLRSVAGSGTVDFLTVTEGLQTRLFLGASSAVLDCTSLQMAQSSLLLPLCFHYCEVQQPVKMMDVIMIKITSEITFMTTMGCRRRRMNNFILNGFSNADEGPAKTDF